ncbi:ROK family transcriptional regulator [Roseivivax sp. THAF30]|jgi:predicted NBD/HSP70 family sugar kinase|uniref:ROK family transcriptional regulator n=1 Tax=Roseivivax sp. THAF30 TaxID=2587852 RepID=UPI001268AF2A|nr:ROK family transcriptional regulator [Roseivivax sp. THAF30]QFT62658.1 N-acetylglucosamine repressor [Roseivivax sp. THAF30]
MTKATIRGLSSGANQQGVRDYNERLILTTIQRGGAMPGSSLAKATGLSPQTISVILRSLEAEGLVERGDPQRGHIGKPRVPMRLRPDGAYSVGLKLGRRNSDMVLTDLSGRILGHRNTRYAFPQPGPVLDFLERGLEELLTPLGADAARVAGIGVARPFEMWKWPDAIGAQPAELNAWADLDVAEEIGRFSDLPVIIENDATAACRAEHIYGRGKEFRDYAYFYIGSFIGGGIVLNHTVFEGASGNAGALGNLPAQSPAGQRGQLLDFASLYLLEDALVSKGEPRDLLWRDPQDWTDFETELGDWTRTAAHHLARAALTVTAIIDFEAVLIDGAFPEAVRARLVDAVHSEMQALDARGLIPPRIEAGSIGALAREKGAATAPIISRYLMDTHRGLNVA